MTSSMTQQNFAALYKATLGSKADTVPADFKGKERKRERKKKKIFQKNFYQLPQINNSTVHLFAIHTELLPCVIVPATMDRQDRPHSPLEDHENPFVYLVPLGEFDPFLGVMNNPAGGDAPLRHFLQALNDGAEEAVEDVRPVIFFSGNILLIPRDQLPGAVRPQGEADEEHGGLRWWDTFADSDPDRDTDTSDEDANSTNEDTDLDDGDMEGASDDPSSADSRKRLREEDDEHAESVSKRLRGEDSSSGRSASNSRHSGEEDADEDDVDEPRPGCSSKRKREEEDEDDESNMSVSCSGRSRKRKREEEDDEESTNTSF